MKSKIMKTSSKFLLLLAFIIPMLTACSNNTLEGTYSGKVTVLFWSGDDKITFSKDKTFKEGIENKGTYEISGDKLTLKFDGKKDEEMTAKLSDDHKSFVIKSAKGLESIAEGTKFTKNN